MLTPTERRQSWRAEGQVQGADGDPYRDEGPPGEEESGRQRVEGSLRQKWSNRGGGEWGQEGRGGLEGQRDQPGALGGSPVFSGWGNTSQFPVSVIPQEPYHCLSRPDDPPGKRSLKSRGCPGGQRAEGSVGD